MSDLAALVRKLVDGHCRVVPDETGTWIRVESPHARLPQQGWKLHVSASIVSAEDVLRRAVPVLLAHDATFKVARSLEVLAELNSGEASAMSQIGKFVTVYPADDEHAVTVAVALDGATRGLRGPSIPSDRPLARGSLVHYRYGAFGGRMLQTPIGLVVPALEAPDGTLVPDERRAFFRPPEWAADPFVAAGLTEEEPSAQPLVGGRYALVATLHSSPRGSVYLGVDLDGARNVAVKRARRNGQVLADGADAHTRLRHEHEVLTRLRPDRRFPEPFDLVEQDGELFLVLEEIEGVTLETYVSDRCSDDGRVDNAVVVRWGRELASMLAAIHERGLVYRDLKSPNVVVSPDGSLRLIDFELAADGRSHGKGTRGYMSPQQAADAPPSVADDVYGLGALLYFATTGAEPSLAPDPYALLDRPLELLNPSVDRRLTDVVARCLARAPEDRFGSAAEVEAALARLGSPPTPRVGVGEEDAEHDGAHHYRELARRLGTTLCASAIPAGVGRVAWRSTHQLRGGLVLRDVNTGVAGTVLALAELADALREPQHLETLAAGAAWLVDAPRPEGFHVPGLYVGEAGVGAALLRAGLVLGDERLLEAAAERGGVVAELPHGCPDLFNGTAGRLRFHLLLREAGFDDQLAHAVACGDHLLATSEERPPGGRCWRIPPGFDGLSGDVYAGYAHGAAGIADVLLDLYEATGDERYRAAASEAAAWLLRLRVPVLDGAGDDWPAVEEGRRAGAFWCHGAAGVGSFFLHAARLGLLPEAPDVAARAAHAVARTTRRAGPTRCHGLAGNLEFLLDVFGETGDRAYLNEALAFARALAAFTFERDGRLCAPSESTHVVTPDYMVGYAGVAVAFLRVALAVP